MRVWHYCEDRPLVQPATTGIISTHSASHFLFVWSDWDVMKELSTVTFQLMSEFEDNNADIRSMGCKHQLEHHNQLPTIDRQGKVCLSHPSTAQLSSLSSLSTLYIQTGPGRRLYSHNSHFLLLCNVLSCWHIEDSGQDREDTGHQSLRSS